MSVYLVTWNLNNEGARYAVARAKVLKQLNAFEYAYDGGHLDTIAVVRVADGVNASFILNHMKSAMDDDDNIIVVEFADDWCVAAGPNIRRAIQAWLNNS